MGFSLFGKNKRSESDTDADELAGKAAPRRRRKSAEEPVDPVLPEKKRARRRLVGVAAMVLAAVIGLPMVMESEPQSLSEDVQIVIPSADKPLAEAPGAPAATPDRSAVDGTEPGGMSGQPAVAATPPSADTVPAAKPPALEVAKPEPAKSNAAKSAQPAPSTEIERIAQVRALLAGQDEPAAAPNHTAAQAKPGQFVLQVAALASAEKVRELQGRLSKAGVQSYTEKVKLTKGEQIRVRVGPFASREEADKMRSKLSGMGLNGMVVPL